MTHTPCSHEDETAYLATCAACREAHAELADERALFELRAAVLEPAPDLLAPILAAADKSAHKSATRRWRVLARATRGVAAAAACAAAITAVARLEAPRYLDARDATNAGESFSSAGSSRELEGESLACAFPASGFVNAGDAIESHDPHARMSFAGEPLACVDLGSTCKELVTSSRARP